MMKLKSVVGTMLVCASILAGGQASARDVVTPTANFGLPATQILYPGDAFVSEDGRFRMTFQFDGNFVLYQGATVLWSSNTRIPPNVVVPGSGGYTMPNTTRPQQVAFQADGNLVIYFDPTPTKDKTPWASNTNGNPNSTFIVQTDGNAVIYNNGRAIWSTKTGGR